MAIRSNLRQLILLLALLSTLITAINMFTTSAKVQKNALIANTLENNKAYAAKIADNAQVFLESIQLMLDYTAKETTDNWGSLPHIQKEIQRLDEQSRAFNSIIVSDKNGYIVAASDSAQSLVGQQAESVGIKAALAAKKPEVSAPFQSSLNNLVVMISTPMFINDEYVGFIGGTIYLRTNNVLKRILGEHYHQNGSYIYVFDQHQRLLYHPDTERIDTPVLNKALVEASTHSNTGELVFLNRNGIEMLSGYAHIPASNWTVVSQRSLSLTLRAHEGMMVKTFLASLPLNLLLFPLIWFFAWIIAYPLRQLTQNASQMDQRTSIEKIQKIPAWYAEVHNLKNTLLSGLQSMHDQVGQLNHDVLTDPLTKLNNRRALEHVVEQLELTHTTFSVIAIDIDHFKHINDTHGHDVGDIVLKELAQLMRLNSREDDFCIRAGGEEFLIILPKCSIPRASDIAERLRRQVEHYTFTPLKLKLTISLGVSAWPIHHGSTSQVLRMADEQLYKAKRTSRNIVCIASI